MKTFVVTLLFFCGIIGFSQDFPTQKPLKIGEKNNLDVKSSNKGGTVLRMPSMFDQDRFKTDAKSPNIQMLPERELVQAGHDMVIDPKIIEKEKNGKSQYFGDMYLGDFKTNATFIGVVARDHEYIDGDRVKIYVNGELVEPNLLLTGTFRGVNVDLKEGFNRIDFEALNQGTSGPNTAQVMVSDETGKILHNNKWNLSTGSVASLVVVKEAE